MVLSGRTYSRAMGNITLSIDLKLDGAVAVPVVDGRGDPLAGRRVAEVVVGLVQPHDRARADTVQIIQRLRLGGVEVMPQPPPPSRPAAAQPPSAPASSPSRTHPPGSASDCGPAELPAPPPPGSRRARGAHSRPESAAPTSRNRPRRYPPGGPPARADRTARSAGRTPAVLCSPPPAATRCNACSSPLAVSARRPVPSPSVPTVTARRPGTPAGRSYGSTLSERRGQLCKASLP